MSNNIVDSIFASNFDQNVEIAERAYDKKWNLWAKELFIKSSPEEEVTWAWTTINVFDTKEKAKAGLEEFRSLIKSKR